MRRLTIIGPDGTERPAPLAMVDALLDAEVSVMGEADQKCRAAGQMIHDDRLNDVGLSNGIVFVEGATGFDRATSAANAAIAGKNIALAIPRLLGNLFGGAAYLVDRQVTGYETLKDAHRTFEADSFQGAYRVELGAGTAGWQHVYMVDKEYVAKAYVLNDPAVMRSFIRQSFRKGAGCQAYRVGD